MVKVCLVLKKPSNCLPKWLCHFSMPQAINESSCSSTCSSIFGVVSFLDFGYLNRHVAASHCLSQNFSGDICEVLFHILNCHLYILFGELFVQVLSPFYKWIIFLFLNCRRFLFSIFGNSHLSDMSFKNVFPSVWLVFLFSSYCLLQSRSFNVMKSRLSIISFVECAFNVVS